MTQLGPVAVAWFATKTVSLRFTRFDRWTFFDCQTVIESKLEQKFAKEALDSRALKKKTRARKGEVRAAQVPKHEGKCGRKRNQKAYKTRTQPPNRGSKRLVMVEKVIILIIKWFTAMTIVRPTMDFSQTWKAISQRRERSGERGQSGEREPTPSLAAELQPRHFNRYTKSIKIYPNPL